MDLMQGIHVINYNDNLYFKAIDIAKLLKHKNIYRAIKYKISDCNKTLYKNISNTNLSYKKNKMVYINKLGLIELIKESTTIVSPMVINGLINKFNLNLDLPIKFIENNYIDKIIYCFKHHNYKINYKVSQYYIDLYFLDFNIAVDSDKKDKNSQLLIQQYLNCKFIRFNPNSKKNNIYKIINKIHIAILTYTKSKNFYKSLTL
ncbi:ORF MSV024 ALI motif gene family protein [Melanoplus sanguinipes entomopoxvirus]|uniref:ORF MSV024 ALI motif gene family protein n=1 Tax=Melanoplus sanguinipes entomopoxvirus TaxID=83191 RepID=Q9YW68_MSEPV|nr:ORF MSV024 ALI motif gene family protein [Melanoplus sanguinipes entomopoxvirus]AAC97847.1 ORF MSV024 ALI motif gene family protein [Melanoplus sanguinipes entomopoxvirus 'O']